MRFSVLSCQCHKFNINHNYKVEMIVNQVNQGMVNIVKQNMAEAPEPAS
jgi:hypothetical protein